MRVLLAEGDIDRAHALASALRRHHMVVDLAPTLHAAQYAVHDARYDVILLDHHLPDGDGLTLLDRFAPTQEERAAVLIISERADVASRVEGLNRGGDDYLPKQPFVIDELLARMRALVRRPRMRMEHSVELGRLRFDTNQRNAYIDQDPLILPRRELLVLEVLLRNKRRTVLRSTMLERVYEGDNDPRSNTLDAHLSRLRAKLQSARAGVEIHAVRGVGYLMREAA